MPKVIKDLLLSKKFVVAMLTAAGSVAAYLGYNVDPTKILAVATPFLVFIGAQGWADVGKERAIVDGATSLRIQAASQQHEKDMLKLRGTGLNAAINAPQDAVPTPVPAGPRGFAKLGVLVSTAALAVGLMVSLAVTAACVHGGQVALQAGQCVLDSGVLGTVLADLEQPNYAQLVSDLTTRVAPDLVNCALQAVASQSGQGSGSGGLPKGTPDSVVVQRAREVLESRKASR